MVVTEEVEHRLSIVIDLDRDAERFERVKTYAKTKRILVDRIYVEARHPAPNYGVPFAIKLVGQRVLKSGELSGRETEDPYGLSVDELPAALALEIEQRVQKWRASL